MSNSLKNSDVDDWLAPQDARLPDFVLCGAMKSGTSTLHYILNKHPHVFIPRKEIGFFDIDNIFEHPNYSFFDGNRWVTQDIHADPVKLWSWYTSHFKSAKVTDVIGEDSTTYLSSKIAAKRLSLQQKNIKLVILLRQPTFRAYSQYWHLVRTGRAKYDFERTILHNPWSVLYRSLYHDHLNSLFNHIDKQDVKIIIFEEFIKNKYAILKDLCSFINIDYRLLPSSAFEAHENKTRIPRFPQLQLFKNRLFPEQSKKINKRLPYNANNERFMHNLLNSLHRKVNPHVEQKLPIMNYATKQFLDNYFKREFSGINEILNKDVMSLWFS